MRNKKWDLIWGILAIIVFIASIIEGNAVIKVFGFEINSWIYRGIWLLIAITNLSQFFIRKKKEDNFNKRDF